MCVCLSVCPSVCLSVWVFASVFVYVCAHDGVCLCDGACVCACACICARVRMYANTRDASPRLADPRTTAIGLMSAAQCVGCLAARIATSTKPGHLRIRCPAHLLDTIWVRNPAAPSPNGARNLA